MIILSTSTNVCIRFSVFFFDHVFLDWISISLKEQGAPRSALCQPLSSPGLFKLAYSPNPNNLLGKLIDAALARISVAMAAITSAGAYGDAQSLRFEFVFT